LGYDLLRQNQDAEAAPLLRRILTFDSTSWQTWLNLATVEKGLGQPDSAITHYQRAFALAPWAETGNDNLNLEYGTTYLMLGDTPAAAAVFSKMLDVDRDRRARGLRSLAYLALLRGEYRKAVRQLTEAIAVNRSSSARVSELRNRLLLASTLEQLGEPGDLREQLDSAFALSQRLDMESTLFFWLGKALARAGDARRAALLLDSLGPRVREGNTDRASLEGLRGEVLVARGDAANAIPHLESMLSADSTAYTLESLAFGVAASGDLDRAAALYTHLGSAAVFGWEGQQYNRLAPYWLGRIEERRGNRAAAVRAFQTFVEAWQQADPDLVALVDARSRLDRLRLSDSPR
jgi:tetratricopeptide (TPR) repeat protein